MYRSVWLANASHTGQLQPQIRLFDTVSASLATTKSVAILSRYFLQIVDRWFDGVSATIKVGVLFESDELVDMARFQVETNGRMLNLSLAREESLKACCLVALRQSGDTCQSLKRGVNREDCRSLKSFSLEEKVGEDAGNFLDVSWHLPRQG